MLDLALAIEPWAVRVAPGTGPIRSWRTAAGRSTTSRATIRLQRAAKRYVTSTAPRPWTCTSNFRLRVNDAIRELRNE
jgi:hypothetical protein